MKKRLQGWFPFPNDYDRTGLRNDLMAGSTVAILLIPQAMAYALLAGVPPVYGIYAGIIPLLLYSLLGSTPHVSVGPTALASILTITALSGIVEVGSNEYLGYCFLLAGLTGIVQLLLGILRLGSIINFLSRPVISGFVSAAAVLILVSQLKPLFGLEVSRSDHFHQSLAKLFNAFGNLHFMTALVGLVSLFSIPLLKKRLSKFPITLVFIIAATLITWFFQLDQEGVAILSDVPNGLPVFDLPSFSIRQFWLLLPAALVLGLVSFIETLSIGKTFQEQYDYYRTQPNRELIALGASKLIGSFFQAIPTSASFSRSAVSEQSGTRTVVSSLFTVFILILCALFIMDWFYYLPLPVLAAIIILSVRKLFDYKEIGRLWKLDKREFSTLIVTFLVTLFGGLQFGILAGVVLSLSFVILKSTQPHLAELGRLPASNAFRNIARFEQAECERDILIIRFDAELFFGNADYFRERLTKLIRSKGDDLKLLIIDAHTIHDLDTSGAFALNGIIDFLERRNARLYLAGAIGPVRDQLFKFGIMDRIGSDHQFLSIQSALSHFRQQDCRDDDWDRPAVQHK